MFDDNDNREWLVKICNEIDKNPEIKYNSKKKKEDIEKAYKDNFAVINQSNYEDIINDKFSFLEILSKPTKKNRSAKIKEIIEGIK